MNVLKSYADLGLARMKAAAEVDSVEALQAFFNSQMDAASILAGKLMEDTRALVELYGTFKADFGKLAQETTAETGQKATTATKEIQETRKTA